MSRTECARQGAEAIGAKRYTQCLAPKHPYPLEVGHACSTRYPATLHIVASVRAPVSHSPATALSRTYVIRAIHTGMNRAPYPCRAPGCRWSRRPTTSP
eukprot:5026581-Prymnesium_polylepis.1